MIMPLIGIMPAYMLVSNSIIPWWQMMAWNGVMSCSACCSPSR
jgi:hypothetical protein